MKIRLLELLAACVILIAPTVRAQDMPDIGFKSVGRGQPLAAKVLDGKDVGPGMDPRSQSQRAANRGHHEAYAGWISPRCAAQRTTSPCPRDLFTSPDFYADKALWSDPPLFPLQCQPVHRAAARHSGPARNEHHQQDRGWAVGPLRVRLSAQGHRQPLRLQDRAGALRGAARGDQEARRPEQVFMEGFSGSGMERRVQGAAR